VAVPLVELIAGGSFDRPIDEEEMEAELRRRSHNEFLLLGEASTCGGSAKKNRLPRHPSSST
jgi:hypothetical protein